MSIELEQIQKDFAAFADPSKPIGVSGDSISWWQGGEQRTATLVANAKDLPRIVYGGQEYDYRTFFASPYMADLRKLAEMTLLLLPKLPGFVGDQFVEPRVTFDDTNATGPAFQQLHSHIATQSPIDRTRLLFLRGRAGDGKSSLLIHLALEQSRVFFAGEASSLYFYINAQGSALARIDEVIAKTLQDFRARFTYHAIATLTRLELLVPIIDGFDELLGVGGYKDAFSSLAVLVSRLEGKGILIASARSTFYQYTNFGTQAARFATDDNPLLFQVVPISLHSWGHAECELYLKRAKINFNLDDLKRRLGARSEEVFSSPFLFGQLIGLGEETIGKASEGHVVRLIVEELIQREMKDKLLDPQGKPLLTVQQHIEFLGMLAEEMWWQETREINDQTFSTLSEIACDQFGLSGDVASRFVNRVPSYALITRLDGPVRIAFRHEFYFAFFLATRIANSISGREDLTTFLSRGVLTIVVAIEVAQSLSASFKQTLPPTLFEIKVDLAKSTAPEVIRTNLGVLYWGAIREFNSRLKGSAFRHALFSGLSFINTNLLGVHFHSCVFNQCDFVDASWQSVKCTECTCAGIVVSEKTRLEFEGISLRGGVVGLVFQLPDGKQKEFYSLHDVGAILERLGTKFAEKLPKEQVFSKRATDLILQLEKFLRVPERTLYFSEDDYFNRGLKLEGELRPIVGLLKKHRLLLETAVHRKGQRIIYRLVESPEAIRQGQAGVSSSSAIQGLWKEIAEA